MAKKKRIVGTSSIRQNTPLFKLPKTIPNPVLEKKKHSTKYLLIVFIALAVLTFIALNIALFDKKIEAIPTCGDGTFYNTCSLDKPYFCEEGILVEKASICGCPKFLPKKEGNFCISEYNKNPIKISLNYFLRGQEREIPFIAYESINNYVSNISRVVINYEEEVPFRSDFKQKAIGDEMQREFLLPLVKKIQNFAPSDKVEQARIAISLVQNIPYGSPQKKTSFGGVEVDYSKYPYEVLYDNEGICGEKSQLLAFILKELGYGVSIFYFSEENHEAVGIQCPLDESFYGSGYCFVETGGPAIITDFSMEFTSRIKLRSRPEIILISEGISLPSNIYEYKDAETLNNIRERNLLGIFNLWRFSKIKEKYNLLEVYIQNNN